MIQHRWTIGPESDKARDVGLNWNDPLASLARERIYSSVAQRWIALLRPAFALGANVDGPTVGRLGGLPMLPTDVPWPTSGLVEPAAPLAYLGSIDCAALPAHQLDMPLAEAGTLHFFAHHECFEEEPGEHQGSRIIYVPAGTDVRQRPAPRTSHANPGYPPLVYEPVELRARLVASAPSFDSPFLGAAFWRPEPDYAFGDGPGLEWIKEATDAVSEIFPPGFRERVFQESVKHHRLGGYAPPGQPSPECALWPRPDYPFRDDHVRGTAANQTAPGSPLGRLLFSIDGRELDGGDFRLHWVIRPGDLAALRFGAAAFRRTTLGL